MIEALTLDKRWLQENFDPATAEVAERILEVVREESADDARRDMVQLATEVTLEDAWPAVKAVHEALDREAESGASFSEIRSARARLVEAEQEVARVQVESELRAYREMLRDISHDIRSPLNSILFLTDGLYKEQSGPLSGTQQRQLGIIYSAAASLLNFVNDIMDFARAGDGESLEDAAEVPFSLDGVRQDVERLVGPLVANRNTDFEIEIDAGDARRGDPQLLCRVLVNLLSNAVEAADDEGWVRCRITDSEDDGERTVIEVEDDGLGAEVDRIREFVEPRTEREMTRLLQGRTHGLGLQICGRLVRTAGGSFEVEKSEEGGARFTVQLPFPSA